MFEQYKPTEDMPDYLAWARAANGAFGFSDYVHAQVLNGNLTADSLGAIVGWLWPSFVEVDGLIVLASNIDKLVELKSQGGSTDELEYWCNFTNVDGILPGMPNTFSVYVAKTIRDMWSAKLERDFPSLRFAIEIVELRDLSEISVTFHQD